MKKILLCLVLVFAFTISLMGCVPQVKVNGFYVIHILFAFDEENSTLITDGELDAEVAAQSLTTTDVNGDERSLFGSEGVYEEIQNALLTLSGQAAINKFEEYISVYNDDPGMDENEQGYLVPLGQSHYVPCFEELARSLFNNENPEASVGNAFIDDFEDKRLGYCVSHFGVHIIMIKSLATY